MLKVKIPAATLWDEKNETFVKIPETTIRLEHSLASVSKWETKWGKPFLSSNKTPAETIDYIRCMSIDDEISDTMIAAMPVEAMEEINNYIKNPMSARGVAKNNKKGRSNEVLTADTIYYCMASTGIPFECEHWHLNRLLALLDVTGEKNTPQKKMAMSEVYRQNRELNAMRRKKFGSNG